MTDEIYLRQLEKKIWLTYFQDGFWDIFLGLMMILGALRALTDNLIFTMFILVGVLVPVLGKRFITIPRLGFVRFNSDIRFQKKRPVVIFAISIVITLALVFLAIMRVAPLEGHSSPFVALLLALVFGMLAYFMDYLPLLLYGLMMSITEITWGLYGVPTGPTLELVFGITVLFIGLSMMIRFFFKYPLFNKGVNSL